MKIGAAFAFLIVVVCLSVPSGCAIAKASADQTKTVRLKFDAFNRRDVDAIKATYASDAILHSPDYPELHGNAPIAETYSRLFDAMPDAKDTIQALGSFEDKVYAQFLLTGHFNGAADKPVSVRIMSVYTIRHGLIVDDSTYYDRKAP
jgi:ketosteroid isomerase-like protein